MDNTQLFIRELLAWRGLPVDGRREEIFVGMMQEDACRSAAQQLITAQQLLMDKWRWTMRLADIQQQPLVIPNGTVGKPYETRINTGMAGWEDVSVKNIDGLEALGLSYDAASGRIEGVPSASGDWPLVAHFTVQDWEGEGVQEKKLTLIINPDPRSLWKEIDSDRSDEHWKEDTAAMAAPLGDKYIVAASVRGRSHANTGAFRDDDMAARYFDDTGWSLVVVADGAGSAKLARAGSSVACATVVDFFSRELTKERTAELGGLLANIGDVSIDQFAQNLLGPAAHAVQQALIDTAAAEGAELKDLHTTLIFTLFRRYPQGYAVFTFGVGDCPVALLHTGLSEVTLMNALDVGEFGGGTRFITLPEIFAGEALSKRIRFVLVDDFAALVLMTDGVYDAKFGVEAALARIGEWRHFLADLEGDNEEGKAVVLEERSPAAAERLAQWLAFWSPGNHDDRTLALVY